MEIIKLAKIHQISDRHGAGLEQVQSDPDPHRTRLFLMDLGSNPKPKGSKFF